MTGTSESPLILAESTAFHPAFMAVLSLSLCVSAQTSQGGAKDTPEKPVAYCDGLLWLLYGLLWSIVACYFGLLGVPGMWEYWRSVRDRRAPCAAMFLVGLQKAC